MIPTREQAWQLLREWTQTPHLLSHALGVEAAMRGYARRFGEDVESWGAVGLLHDFDYDRHPSLQEHPFVGADELRRRGVDEDFVRAVLAHADHTGVSRESRMEHTLYAVDEMVGFIVAAALIRPGRSILDLPVPSVTKKLKDKAFCRAVDRDHLRGGAAAIGVPLDEHIGNLIDDLRGIAGAIGLDGKPAT